MQKGKILSVWVSEVRYASSFKVTIALCNNAYDPNGHGYQPYVGIPNSIKVSQPGINAGMEGTESEYGNTAADRFQRRYPSRHAGFCQSGRTGTGAEPRYPTYTSLSKILGAEVISYDLKEEDG